MDTRKRVLLIGDSLAFARATHGQLFSEAWPVLVKDALPEIDIWQRCRPAATIVEVKGEFGLFASFSDQFSHVVIQVGVTDSCPRPFPYVIQRLLSMFASQELQRAVGRNYHKLLKFRSKPWISPERFRESLSSIIQSIHDKDPHTRVAIVRVIDAGASFIAKVSDVQTYIDLYNKIITEVVQKFSQTGDVRMLEPYSGRAVDTLLLQDGHHLNKEGHQLLARDVIQFIK